MAWVKNAAGGAFFRACEGGWRRCQRRAVWRRGCKPVLDIEAPKNPGGPLGEARAGPTCEG